MPRKARIILPDCPHHIVQRGHNRQAVFVEQRDYQYYLGNLAASKAELGCKVYGYCLMTNHVHLIVDPGDEPENLGRLIKTVAGRQTRLVNRLEQRTGSLWEGRYKSSPIETERYLMACCRYVELNPVRAGMVRDPADYPWSSFQAKAGLAEQDWLDFDPYYCALGGTSKHSRARYSEWVRLGSADNEISLIRTALQRGQLTGSNRFREQVEARTGLRVECRGRGRPRND